MRVIYHPDAEAELIAAALYYESERNGLGSEFVDEIEAAIVSILEDPRRLPRVNDDIHRQFVNRFPYELYFRALDKAVRILAVKHHRRDSGSWETQGHREVWLGKCGEVGRELTGFCFLSTEVYRWMLLARRTC